uniref:GAGE domain-containing protein n=1 Tax=Cebus imitator TaxID=2715852 RepID=A0A2K5Q3I3_CEBIM
MGFRRRLIYPCIPICYIESSEQSSDEEPEEMEPPTKNQDPAPAPERMDEGVSAAQGLEPEADSQEQVQLMPGCEPGDGPAAKKIRLQNLQVKLPEEGEGQSQH